MIGIDRKEVDIRHWNPPTDTFRLPSPECFIKGSETAGGTYKKFKLQNKSKIQISKSRIINSVTCRIHQVAKTGKPTSRFTKSRPGVVEKNL